MKILKFTMPFCLPCRQLEGELSKGELDLPLISYNALEEEELTKKYEIRKAPTILIVDDEDNVLFKHSGVISLEELNDEIDKCKKEILLPKTDEQNGKSWILEDDWFYNK